MGFKTYNTGNKQSLDKFAHARKQHICPRRITNRDQVHHHQMWECSFPALSPNLTFGIYCGHLTKKKRKKSRNKKKLISCHFVFVCLFVLWQVCMAFTPGTQMYSMKLICLSYFTMNQYSGRLLCMAIFFFFACECEANPILYATLVFFIFIERTNQLAGCVR